MASFTVTGVTEGAQAALKSLQAQVEALAAQVAVTNQEQVAGATEAIAANSNVVASYENLVAALRAETEAQVALQQQKITAIKLEIAAVGSLTKSYAAGSAERQVLVEREIALQESLTAAIGVTAAAQTKQIAGGALAGGAVRGAERGGVAALEERAAVRGFASRATGVGGAFAGPGFIAGAVTAVAAHEALQALRSIQEETAQLEGVQVKGGKTFGDYRKQVEETVKAEEELGIKESETLRGLTTLGRVTGGVAKTQRDLKLATDISAGAHIDLDKAVGAVVQAENGRFRGLSRLIGPVKTVTKFEDELKNAHIKVTDANREQMIALQHLAARKDKEATRDAAIAKAQEKFAGDAQRHMKTDEGATERRRVAIEKLEVQIGRGLLPIEQKLNDAIAKGADFLRKNKDVAEALHTVGAALNTTFKLIAVTFELVAKVLDTRLGKVFLKIVFAWAYWPVILLAKWKEFFEWLEKKALTVAAAILEPFTHLPFGMGKWAQRAKDAVNAQLDQLKIDAAIKGGSLGDTIGSNMVAAFTPYLGTLQAQLNALSPGAPGSQISDAGGMATKIPAGLISPVPKGAQKGIIGTPGVGTHAQSDWQSRNAIDIKVAKNTPILAVEEGDITKVTINPPGVTTTATGKRLAGSSVTLRGGFNTYFYTHLLSVAVQQGDHVKRGEIIGHAGALDHVHFAVEHGSPVGFETAPHATVGGRGTPGRSTPASSRDDAEAEWKAELAKAKRDEQKAAVEKFKLPEKFRQSIARARGTAGREDDITAYLAAIKEINRELPRLTGKARTAALSLRATYTRGVTTARGLPTGGGGGGAKKTYGYAELMGLWEDSGGQKSLSAIMAAIAMAESGGRSWAIGGPNSNGTFDYGCWQINSAHGLDKAKLLDGDQRYNAKAAVGIWHSQGLGAWSTYNSGAYEKFLRDNRGTESQAPTPAGQQRATAAGKRIEAAKALGETIKSAVTGFGKQTPSTVEDVFGDIASQRGTIESLGLTVKQALEALTPAARAAVEKAQSQIKSIRDKIAAGIKSGLVSNAQLAAWRKQLRTLGQTVEAGLTEAAIRASHAQARTISAITKAVTDRQGKELKAFDKVTQDHLQAMQRSFANQMKQFDKETQRVLQSFVVKETPAEGALRSFQDQRAAQQRAAQQQDLQKALTDALAGGDPQAIKQAQDAINQALLDEQEDALQKAAEASRQAQDDLTQRQQDAYQEQRDNLRQSLEDRESLLEQSYQDSRDIIREGMEEANADELDKLNENLEVWQAWLGEKAQAVGEFYDWLKTTYGVGPGGVPWAQPWGDNAKIGMDDPIGKALARKFTGPARLQHGGTISAPWSMNRDAVPILASHGETVIDRSLTDALERLVATGSLGGGVQVVVTGNTLLGRDRDVARAIADATGPEIERRIGYKTIV